MKNQCSCGCCWAFATVQQIESDAIRTKNWSVNSPLSTAQACECTYSPYRNGCDGGWPDDAYDYVKSIGGVQPDVNRPYNSSYYCGVSCASSCQAKTCTAPSSSYAVKVSDYYYTPSDEPSIASYVQTTGPAQVFVGASDWHTYISGTMTVCPNNGINHVVQVVGVDTVAGYWKLRNSWGSNWGEAGHIRLAYNSNMCNIGLYGATYTAVELTNAPTAVPTMVSTAPGSSFCPSFSVTNTSSGTINYATCSFTACPGDTVVMSTLSPGSCTGDTYLRLYDPSTGNQLAANDDFSSSSLCSQLSYTFTASCRAYTLREGCYQSLTCGGQVVYSGNTLSEQISSPSSKPTIAVELSKTPTVGPTTIPTAAPTNLPSTLTKPTANLPSQRPTRSPSSRPSRAPFSKPTTNRSKSPSSRPSASQVPTTVPSTTVSIAPGSSFCPSFSVTNTSSGTINYATCHITACPGDTVVMSTLSPGSCTGDTYLRLYDPSTDNQLAENDDYNGTLCSQLTYTFTASCRAYTLREGCYQSLTCGGRVVYSGNTLLL